jgi:hypothetical protein
MPKIPMTESAAVVRTDFVNASHWSNLKSIAEAPPEPFFPNLSFVDDVALKAKRPEDIIGMLPCDYPHTFIILADAISFRSADFPCLVMDLKKEADRQPESTRLVADCSKRFIFFAAILGLIPWVCLSK